MTIEEIISRQDKEEQKLDELDHKFFIATQKYKDCIATINIEIILKQNNIPFHNDPKKNLSELENILTNNPSKYNKVLAELNNYEEFKKSNTLLDERDEAKYKYFTQLLKYLSILEEDRKSLFDENYIKKLDYLADKGYFIYFLQIPDYNIVVLEENKLENYIISLLSSDNFLIPYHLFSEAFSIKNFDNKIANNKVNDLKEALDNISRANYNSCARTMFALLENEHYRVSGCADRTKINIRSEKINILCNKLNLSYYKNMWDKMSSFYDKCHVSIKNQNETDINRNDLAHGAYKKISTKEDCIKLILLYINMKWLGYVLNNYDLLINELEIDIKLYDIITNKDIN